MGVRIFFGPSCSLHVATNSHAAFPPEMLVSVDSFSSSGNQSRKYETQETPGLGTLA